MASLPPFRSLGARRRENKEEKAKEQGASQRAGNGVINNEDSSDQTLTPAAYGPGINIKMATRKRETWILISCFFFFVSVVFLVLTLIGNTYNKAVLRDTWFISLDLADIIPASTPSDIILVNSLARSLGLHDFYQVGLWGFCEGYNNEGITSCSKPKALYWFNPVEILLNELLSGATISLPAEINTILKLIRLASNVMFGCFLAGICMNFVNIFFAPVTLYSRWWSFPFSIFSFIAALLTTAAAIIATAMFIIFKTVLTSQSGLNIGATIGKQMFAFMWIGAAFSIFGWLIHLSLSCCCASRRDVRTGRKKGNEQAYNEAINEKSRPIGGNSRLNLPKFRRNRRAGEVV